MATNTKKTSSTETAKPPVAKLKDGRIFLSIWERATEKGSFYSITLERRYKNKNEEWASSRSLNEDDLLGASELLKQAYKEIKHLRSPLRNTDAA